MRFRVRPHSPAASLAFALLAAVLCGLFITPRAWPTAVGIVLTVIIGAGWPWMALAGVRAAARLEDRRCRVDVHATNPAVQPACRPRSGRRLSRPRDDIQTVAGPVLAVRSILPPDEFASFVNSLLNDVSVPV